MNAENQKEFMWSKQELDEKSRWAFGHPHDAKERRRIRTDIADEIEEMLAKEGFVRCRTTFLRARGGDLLQYVSVRCFGTWGQPEIDVDMMPLYNVFDYAGRMMNAVITDEGAEGESLETLQGIRVHPIYNSYLAHKDDYLSEMGQEKELLKSVMENINRIDDLETYDIWFEKNVAKEEGSNHLVRLPYLLAHKKYENANFIMTRYVSDEEDAYQKIQTEYNCGFEKVEDMMPARTKTYKEFKKLICAMNAKNDEEVVKTLNQWKIEAYYAIEKKSKTFCRKYPMTLIP